MKRLLICVLLSLPTLAIADEAVQLEPMQMEDGSRTWRVTFNSALPLKEEYVVEQIRLQLGRALFCGNGWEISERKKSFGVITVEGRCK